MNTPTNSKKKTPRRTPRYRPVLSAAEVSYINKLLKNILINSSSQKLIPSSRRFGKTTAYNNYTMLTALASKFSVLEAKIANKAITPDYTASPLNREQQQLVDLGEEPSTTGIGNLFDPSIHDKEQIWKRAYEKWLEDPIQCSLQEIDDANEYRYLNDLMSPEEVERMDREAGATTIIHTQKYLKKSEE